MPNAKRIVIPHLSHHIFHRSNLRQKVFFLDSDRRLYLEFLAEHARHHGVAVDAYCLMHNHVHIIATPHDINGLHHTFERVEGITRAPFISASTPAAISGRDDSVLRPWMKATSGREWFMSNKIPFRIT